MDPITLGVALVVGAKSADLVIDFAASMKLLWQCADENNIKDIASDFCLTKAELAEFRTATLKRKRRILFIAKERRIYSDALKEVT